MRSKQFLLRLLVACLPCAPVSVRHASTSIRTGHVTYSNAPVPNAKKIGCIDAPAPVKGPATTEPTKPGQGTPQPGSKLPDGSQPKASDDRRKALVEELAREQYALVKAREALAQQESIRLGDERNYARVLERLKPYQDEVAAHEKKITELRQELANLR